jgi:hypothetical protein
MNANGFIVNYYIRIYIFCKLKIQGHIWFRCEHFKIKIIRKAEDSICHPSLAVADKILH